MKIINKLFLIVLFLSVTNSFAQLELSNEFGITFGPVTMQTDYGERYHLPSSTETSFGLGIVHYLSFYGSNYNWRNGASFFSDHFKLRSEVSYYFNNSLEHKGAYVEGSGDFVDRMKGMKGKTKVFNFGAQLEYYFNNLEDYGLLFNNDNKFAPYISVGLQYNIYDPEFETNYGSGDYINDPTGVLPKPWQKNAIFVEKGNTFSFTMSAGTRYRIADFDLVLDVRWQHFFSDKIDGLDAAPENVSGSKFNDTAVYFSVGVVIDPEIFSSKF